LFGGKSAKIARRLRERYIITRRYVITCRGILIRGCTSQAYSAAFNIIFDLLVLLQLWSQSSVVELRSCSQ